MDIEQIKDQLDALYSEADSLEEELEMCHEEIYALEYQLAQME